jgi:hypothetical protein
VIKARAAVVPQRVQSVAPAPRTRRAQPRVVIEPDQHVAVRAGAVAAAR